MSEAPIPGKAAARRVSARRERARSANGHGGTNGAGAVPHPMPGALPAALSPEWREFVGRWLASAGCVVKAAARGDWEVELSPALQRRWRRQRVRLVFDPVRATLPRGAWFTAPGSTGGRKILEAALEPAHFTRRSALVHVPGAAEEGIAGVCKVRGLTWGHARLGPVHYERRLACHAVVTRWGGLPWQEPWVLLLGPDGGLVEWHRGLDLPEVRSREGLYQIGDAIEPEARDRWVAGAREHLERILGEHEEEWDRAVARLRDDELERLGSFFSSRLDEEEERLRRRTGSGDDGDIEHGDGTSLKLEWERRAAEVRERWALKTQVRLWGLVEWSWPVAELEQELRAGAVHVRLTSRVDVARGRPALPRCPTCGEEAEMLVRSHGTVACAKCA